MLWLIIISLQIIPVQTLPDVSLKKDTLQQEVIPESAFYTESCSQIVSKNLSPEIWRQELNSLRQSIERNQCFNPGVASTFIDKVITNNAVEHFDFAEELFNRSLQKTQLSQSDLHHIKAEARKLFPLLTDEVRNEWKQKIENDDPTLADDIKNFWQIRDPVLSTSQNERLKEHWKRIAFAREEFTKNRDGVYDTDDRGTIYIKMGAPTYKRSGMLTLESTEIKSKLYDLSYFKGGINPREMFNLQMSIKQQYVPKYYEVWVYRNLGSRRPILFIFGESAKRGTFGLRESVEEFISSGAYRMGLSSSWRYDTGPRGLTAGPFLQMSLYNQLSTIDIYFGRQLSEYDRNWLKYLTGDMNFRSLNSLNNSFRAERELRKIQEQAPDAYSAITKNLDLIDQNYRIYRFLDENNEPVNKVIVFGTPHDKLLPNDALIFQHQYPVYEMNHTIRLFDTSGNQTYLDNAEILLQKNGTNATGEMLEIPALAGKQVPDSSTVLLSSEVSRIPTATNSRHLHKNIVIASSVEQISKMGSLSREPDTLEVSDIIWGYNSEQKNHNIDNLPFAIPLDAEVPQGRNLMVYFETYRLRADSTGLFNYRMDYSIHQKQRRKIVDTGIKLTVNFSSKKSTAKELVEIDTSELEPGSYRIFCRFRNEDSKEPVVRTIDFEIND